MTTAVHESTGSIRNIAVDDALIFPDVQTCTAVVTVAGGQRAGVAIPITSFHP
ncbi:MAG TPA: hypothetical protein VL242_39280 [Sorangium sp.]|nr:hypothetical protein [Sorangium sp.]